MSHKKAGTENNKSNDPVLNRIEVRLARVERDLYWLKIIIVSVFLPIQLAVLTLLLNMLH